MGCPIQTDRRACWTCICLAYLAATSILRQHIWDRRMGHLSRMWEDFTLVLCQSWMLRATSDRGCYLVAILQRLKHPKCCLGLGGITSIRGLDSRWRDLTSLFKYTLFFWMAVPQLILGFHGNLRNLLFIWWCYNMGVSENGVYPQL